MFLPSMLFHVDFLQSLHHPRYNLWRRSSALAPCNKEMRQTLIHCKERKAKRFINEMTKKKSCKISRDKPTETNNWQRLLQH